VFVLFLFTADYRTKLDNRRGDLLTLMKIDEVVLSYMLCDNVLKHAEKDDIKEVLHLSTNIMVFCIKPLGYWHQTAGVKGALPHPSVFVLKRDVKLQLTN